ncbi:MAG: hypothetical protein AB7E72_16670 [Lysobacterales bacterium]
MSESIDDLLIGHAAPGVIRLQSGLNLALAGGIQVQLCAGGNLVDVAVDGFGWGRRKSGKECCQIAIVKFIGNGWVRPQNVLARSHDQPAGDARIHQTTLPH